MYIERSIRPLVESILSQDLVAVIYGARQVGKTTLVKEVSKKYSSSIYLNCDDPLVAINLTNKSALELKAYVGNADIVILDEAQRIENIGITIKLLHDTYPSIKLLVTGSSSLDLANKIKEPLTGRSQEVMLYPLSITEVSNNQTEVGPNTNLLMVRGGYPGIWQLSSSDAFTRLDNIANNYIYRDAFSPNVIYDQTTINDLLRLLAYQIGNEVSYGEIAARLSVSKETIARYIDLLEKAFIVFRRNQYRRNQRAEVGRLRKIYFTDLGIRNAIVDNFKPLDIRDDIGALWENFCAIERLKYLQTTNRRVKSYYWRNNDKREIDLIEEEGDQTRAFECKYGINKLPVAPVAFKRLYPESTYSVVNPNTFSKEILI
jgi:predicted AAA+ superfamily ATPase